MNNFSTKRIKRSNTDKMIGGVCGGIASYLDVDPTLIRLAFALGTLFSFFVPGVLFYFVAWIIIPSE